MKAFRIATLLASLLVLIAYVAMVARYLALPGVLDHGEATICCDAKIGMTGRPLYHAADSPQRYSILYGPATFLIVAGSLQTFGATIFAAKIPSAFAALIAIVCCINAFRPIVGVRSAVGISAVIVLGFLCQRHFSFWIRPDPFEIACVAISLAAVSSSRKYFAIIVVGVSIGIAVNLKLHAIVYFLPLLALIVDRFGWKSAIVSCTLSLPIAIGPFLLPNISLRNYLVYLTDATHHGFGGEQIERIAIWIALMLAAMLCAIRWNGRAMLAALNSNGRFGFTLLVSLLLIGIFGSKSGAGAHHLMPLFPLVGYFCAMQFVDAPCRCVSARILAGAGLLIILALLIPSLVVLLRQERSMARTKVEAELTDLMRSHPRDHFQMGWGGVENYRYTNARPILVFNNQPFFIDPLSVIDSDHAGRPLSASSIDLLLAHPEITWLIPRPETGDATPFTMSNPFDPSHQLVPENFRQAFVEHFHRVGLTKHFELWASSSKPAMTDN